MRKRYHVAWLGSEFKHAAEVKEVFKKEYPDIEFQIRRRKDSFELVKRLSYNDAQQEQQKQEGLYTKKKRKRSRFARIN